MRERSLWKRPLLEQLRRWKGAVPVAGGDLDLLCDVELSLHLLTQVAPDEPADGFWVLLTGYDYPLAPLRLGAAQQRLVHTARHLVLPYKSRREWRRGLETYLALPDALRLFELDRSTRCPVAREVSVAPQRTAIYAEALRGAPPHRRGPRVAAEAGTYLVSARTGTTSVRVPPELVAPLPDGHDLGGTANREPLRVPWKALLKTAKWMDDQLSITSGQEASWSHRMGRGIHLELWDARAGAFAPVRDLTVDGVLHLVGMVSSGKSTLMHVLAVDQARRGKRVTVVVGDVVSALEHVKLYRALGLNAAPILGASNRRKHLEKMHRVLERTQRTLLEQGAENFHYLSTACAIDGLRDTKSPLPLDDAPCNGLHPADADDAAEGGTDAGLRRARICPVYARCQRHQASRDLVDADIWVATPASLVYTPVPGALNTELLRYAELVARRSDLVVVDEADQVQVQLDIAFSPSQVLIDRTGGGWLDTVVPRAEEALARDSRRQLGSRGVRTWIKSATTARAAVHRLYALLSAEPWLQEAIARDYFTSATLKERLLDRWSKVPRRPSALSAAELDQIWEAFLDDPLNDDGERDDSDLARLAKQVLAVTSDAATDRPLRSWLVDEAKLGLQVDGAAHKEEARWLEFTLLLTVLADRLNVIVRGLRQVEVPLGLDGNGARLFQRPPEDYGPLLPEAPMGNVLGFQYTPAEPNSEAMGTLEFFRCAGVGRVLLTRLPHLLAADGLAGPNVLLLSGTSWAGASPSYHIQVPVGGILHAPDREKDAIARSRMRFLPLRDRTGRPIRVSGSHGTVRASRLEQMVWALTQPGPIPGSPSRLEQERLELERRGDDRARVLLVVHSYDEARLVYDVFQRLGGPWRDAVRYLVRDEDEGEAAWARDGVLRRGDVASFAQTDAWVLIAPLQAIERGHNILNEQDRAALGAAYFLVRPYPRPDDLSFAIHSINRWAMDPRPATYLDPRTGQRVALPDWTESALHLDERGRRFRRSAHARWRSLLRQDLRWRGLKEDVRAALSWNELVSIWQVIGRLVRGGCDANVYFCDAAFAPESSDAGTDTEQTSFLVSFRSVLAPYFDPASEGIEPGERALASVLYGPLYTALKTLSGVAA